MADVIVKVINNRAVVQVAGAEALLRLAETATRENAERAENALEQIEEIATGAPDAPSVLNKLDKMANLSDLTDPEASRWNLGVAYASDIEAKTGTDAAKTMTPLRAKQQLRTVVEYINPREPQYAGGALVDGVTDCRAAVQAAIDAARAMSPNKFLGGSIRIKLPAGLMRFTSVHPTLPDRVLDITGADNIVIDGEGMGVTTLSFSPNVPLFKSDSTAADTLFRFGLRDMLIVGPYLKNTAPASNTTSAGLWTGSMNNCLVQNVQVYACGTAFSWADCFHAEFYNIRVNGLGDLACRDGLYARDGDLAQAENSVGIYGGRIFGCGRYGLRGECITGTCIFGLEVLGCGLVGVYLGDSPGGKDLKWFTWSGGLIDTCPDLIVIRKGSSTVAKLLHWSGMWMGYASEAPPGNGVGLELTGVTDMAFRADMMVNMSRMAEITTCSRITLDIATISDYDRAVEGNVALLLVNSSKCTVRVGTATKQVGSPSVTAYLETGTSNHNLITGIFDGAVTTVGAQTNKVGTTIY